MSGFGGLLPGHAVRAYLGFAREHWRLLAFGALLTAFSAYGQTFFVSLFGAELRAEHHLSHGDFGGLYSVATLASGLSIALCNIDISP